jgi:hypothetical protein
MAVQLGALRDALEASSTPTDKAAKAAEEAAGHENRLAKVESDLLLPKWMVATNIALTLLVSGKQFGMLG